MAHDERLSFYSRNHCYFLANEAIISRIKLSALLMNGFNSIPETIVISLFSL
jgi:hypothetical protein